MAKSNSTLTKSNGKLSVSLFPGSLFIQGIFSTQNKFLNLMFLEKLGFFRKISENTIHHKIVEKQIYKIDMKRATFIKKRHNKIPGKRLEGSPLYCPPKRKIKRTIFVLGWTTFSKKVKISPQEYLYQGFPPILSTETPKTLRTNSVLRGKEKCGLISTKVKIIHMNTFIRVPSYIIN